MECAMKIDLSDRGKAWLDYFAFGPVASDEFMEGLDEPMVQERVESAYPKG